MNRVKTYQLSNTVINCGYLIRQRSLVNEPVFGLCKKSAPQNMATINECLALLIDRQFPFWKKNHAF